MCELAGRRLDEGCLPNIPTLYQYGVCLIARHRVYGGGGGGELRMSRYIVETYSTNARIHHLYIDIS